MARSVYLRQVFGPRLSDFLYEDVIRGYDGPQTSNISAVLGEGEHLFGLACGLPLITIHCSPVARGESWFTALRRAAEAKSYNRFPLPGPRMPGVRNPDRLHAGAVF